MTSKVENQIRQQIKKTEKVLRPEKPVYAGLKEMFALIKMFFVYMEKGCMDKKMAKVTKQIKTAERDVKKGKSSAAVKALKGAEKKNVKLTKIDREVRDPMIEKCKKAMKSKKR
jgi:hypothetical protein